MVNFQQKVSVAMLLISFRWLYFLLFPFSYLPMLFTGLHFFAYHSLSAFLFELFLSSWLGIVHPHEKAKMYSSTNKSCVWIVCIIGDLLRQLVKQDPWSFLSTVPAKCPFWGWIFSDSRSIKTILCVIFVHLTECVNTSRYTYLVYHPFMRHPCLSSWAGMTALAEAKLPCKAKAVGPCFIICNIKARSEKLLKDFAPTQRTRRFQGDLLNSLYLYLLLSIPLPKSTTISYSLLPIPFSAAKGRFLWIVNVTMLLCCMGCSVGPKQGSRWSGHSVPPQLCFSPLTAFWSKPFWILEYSVSQVLHDNPGPPGSALAVGTVW